MAQSSFHGLDDLGSMAQCDHGNLGDYLSQYSTLRLNITHIPISLYQGVCLPKECTQEKLSEFSDKVSILLTSTVTGLQKKLHLFDFSKGYGLVKEYSRLYVTLEESEPAVEEWYASVSVGYVVALVFCGIMFVVFCCAPNIFHLIRHFTDNKPLSNPNVDWAY